MSNRMVVISTAELSAIAHRVEELEQQNSLLSLDKYWNQTEPREESEADQWEAAAHKWQERAQRRFEMFAFAVIVAALGWIGFFASLTFIKWGGR